MSRRIARPASAVVIMTALLTTACASDVAYEVGESYVLACYPRLARWLLGVQARPDLYTAPLDTVSRRQLDAVTFDKRVRASSIDAVDSHLTLTMAMTFRTRVEEDGAPVSITRSLTTVLTAVPDRTDVCRVDHWVTTWDDHGTAAP